jgi:hypothetical protein
MVLTQLKMNKLQHYIGVILIPLLGLTSCEKAPISEDLINADGWKVFPSENVKWALDAIPGEGVALLTFIDNEDNYQFKLIDNSGNEIWTKDFGYTYRVSPRTQIKAAAPDTLIHIIYDIDNTFAIFRGSSLKKINHKGNVVFSDPSFLNGMEKVNVDRIVLGNTDNYLVLGDLSISGNRAFASEYNRQGQQVYIKTYSVNLSGLNTFTDAQALEDGNHLLAGTFESKTAGLSSSFFLANLAPNGDLTLIKNNEMRCTACVGRQLYKTKEGEYVYLISAIVEDALDSRSLVYHVNQAGDISHLDSLDLTSFNLASRSSLVQKGDGSFAGIIKSKNHIRTLESLGSLSSPTKPNTYTGPVYSYYFSLNEIGIVKNKVFFTTSYSNYFNSIIKLSNNRILIFGALQSFGEDNKLSIIFKES